MAIDPNLMHFAVGQAQIPNGQTAEQRCYQIILKAIERGYEATLGNTDQEQFNIVAFWWGHRSFFDHDFAKAYWGEEKWSGKLQTMILLDDDYGKLDYLEKFL